MGAILNPIDERYRDLLAGALPRVIHTDEENEHYIAALETLHEHGHLTPEEEQLSELLTLLIEDFENKHYQLRSATSSEIIRDLMDANLPETGGPGRCIRNQERCF